MITGISGSSRSDLATAGAKLPWERPDREICKFRLKSSDIRMPHVRLCTCDRRRGHMMMTVCARRSLVQTCITELRVRLGHTALRSHPNRASSPRLRWRPQPDLRDMRRITIPHRLALKVRAAAPRAIAHAMPPPFYR